MHVQTHAIKSVDINRYTDTPIRYIPEVFLFQFEFAKILVKVQTQMHLLFSFMTHLFPSTSQQIMILKS